MLAERRVLAPSKRELACARDSHWRIPKGAAAPFGTPTLCARSSVLYLCGGDAAGVLRPCRAIHAAVSMQMAVSSLFTGGLPVASPPQRYTVFRLTVCVLTASHHAKICAIMVITTLESR